MVSDYNDNYNHGPDVAYPERKRRKSQRQKRKIIIIVIILVILAAAIVIVATSFAPHQEVPDEDLSWYYEMQKEIQEKKELESPTESRVYDLSNSSNEIKPIFTRINNKPVTMLYDSNLTFSYNPTLVNPYYLKMSNIKPNTNIVFEYSIPDISFNRSVLDRYITKTADDGVIITIGEKYKEVEYNYPDPDAMLKIIITDENGSEILTDGYNVGYDSSKKQTFSLYSGGDFNVELRGSKINASVKIYKSMI